MNEAITKYQSDSPDSEGTEDYQRSYRWVILGLLWFLYFAFGLVARSIPPLITPIIRDLQMSYSQMGFILGTWQLTYIAVAIIGGTIIDKWGVRKSLFVGTLIMGLSVILRYFPQQFEGMLFAVALFGVGAPMISIGCPKAISTWFRGKGRATGVGIYMTAPWVGGILALSLTNSFVMPLTGYSWRLTFVYYGLVVFMVALLWWFLAKETKQVSATESTGIVEVFVNLLKLRKVQIILIMGLLAFATNHGLSNWLPRILETSGLSPTVAGYAASIPMAVGIPAILVIPQVTPPQFRGRIVALFALLAAAATITIVTTSGALFIAGLILFGMTVSALMPLLILTLMDSPEVGSRYMGSAGGLFFCVAEIGGFGGPLIIGVLVDITGTFLVGAILLAGMMFALFAMASLLKTHS